MTVIAASAPGTVFLSDFDTTTIIAPNVTIGAIGTFGILSDTINYGTIGPANSTNGASVSLLHTHSNFTNKVDGLVISSAASISAIVIADSGNIVNEGIVLSSQGHGIAINGAFANNQSIVNSGDLYGGLNGIWVAAASAQHVTISNSGEIIGDANGIHMQFAVGAAPVIINTGVITGRGSSIIATDGDRLNVTNYGTLNGHVNAIGADLTDSVLNNGRIVGNVNLGSGIDIYRGAGIVTGTVFGEAGNDALAGGNAADKLDGGTENDTLTGNGGGDILAGGIGNDTLFGGLGVDTLTGGANNDFFVFNTALNASTNRDFIVDFDHVADTFKLENAVFTKLGAGVHALNPAFFRAGVKALDANDYIVYNRSTGALSYDSDGNGAHAAIQFATLQNHAVIAYNDFVVI